MKTSVKKLGDIVTVAQKLNKLQNTLDSIYQALNPIKGNKPWDKEKLIARVWHNISRDFAKDFMTETEFRHFVDERLKHAKPYMYML